MSTIEPDPSSSLPSPLTPETSAPERGTDAALPLADDVIDLGRNEQGPEEFMIEQIDGGQPGQHAASSHDPWAHRRGEPRVFAFFWTLYVMFAVAGSVTWVARFAPITAGSYGPAARIMLVVVAVGATILWPMTRLCQGSPGRGAPLNALADVLVIVIPLQMIIWPLMYLAQWPALVVAAISLVAMGWVFMIGGVLSIALGGASVEHPRDPALLTRSLWMVMIVMVVLAAPVAMLLHPGRGGSMPSWLPMLSPLSAINDITGRGMAGPQKPVSGLQWRLIAATFGLAAAVWCLGGMRLAIVAHQQKAA